MPSDGSGAGAVGRGILLAGCASLSPGVLQRRAPPPRPSGDDHGAVPRLARLARLHAGKTRRSSSSAPATSRRPATRSSFGERPLRGSTRVTCFSRRSSPRPAELAAQVITSGRGPLRGEDRREVRHRDDPARRRHGASRRYQLTIRRPADCPVYRQHGPRASAVRPTAARARAAGLPRCCACRSGPRRW